MNDEPEPPKKRRLTNAERAMADTAYKVFSEAGLDWQLLAIRYNEIPNTVMRRFNDRGEGHLLNKRKSGPKDTIIVPITPAQGTLGIMPASSIAAAMAGTLQERGQQTKANLAAVLGDTVDAMAELTQAEKRQAKQEGRAAIPLMLGKADKMAALVTVGKAIQPEHFGEEKTGSKGSPILHAALMRLEVVGAALPVGVKVIEVQSIIVEQPPAEEGSEQ